MGRNTAIYVDNFLQGSKPEDLLVEVSSKIESHEYVAQPSAVGHGGERPGMGYSRHHPWVGVEAEICCRYDSRT
jgi:hypothetical protein